MKIVQGKKSRLSPNEDCRYAHRCTDKWQHTSTGKYAGFQYKYQVCPGLPPQHLKRQGDTTKPQRTEVTTDSSPSYINNTKSMTRDRSQVGQSAVTEAVH